MKNDMLYNSVLEMTLVGLGRRSIAKELGVPEWTVRKIIKELVDAGKAEYAKPGRHKNILVPEVEKNEAPSFDGIKVKSRTVAGDKVFILSDIHIPYHDEKALAIAIEYMRDNTPDHIVLNGDIADFYSVSSYEKQMKGRLTFEEEVEAVVSFFTKLRDLFPDAKMSFLEGNHETRLRKYLQRNAPELEMGILSLPKLFKLEEMQIDYYPPNRPLQLGKLLITHGELCRKAAGSTARGHRDKYNSSIAIGHIHRGSVAYQRTRTGQDIMIENGCLCKMDVDYGNFFDWLHGFTEILFDGDDLTAHTHAIINYKLITPAGDVYEAE